MRIIALCLLSACAVDSGVNPVQEEGGIKQDEWTCEDLVQNSSLGEDQYLLVPNVDPQGWVALVNTTTGSGRFWLPSPDVIAADGGIVLNAQCLPGSNVRLSWW